MTRPVCVRTTLRVSGADRDGYEHRVLPGKVDVPGSGLNHADAGFRTPDKNCVRALGDGNTTTGLWALVVAKGAICFVSSQGSGQR